MQSAHPQQTSGSAGTAFPPQQPQQQQQHFPHQGLNGGWQSDKDYQERRKMIAKIVHLLQQRKPNAPQEWLKKLPQMAKRLEESLYRSAKSFEEYNDANTLKQRLQQLAVNIGMKTKKLQQQQQQQQLMQQQNLPNQQPQPGISNQLMRQAVPAQQQQQQQQPLVKPQTQQTLIPAPAGGQQRMVNMSEINPIMGAQSATQQQQVQQQQMQQAPIPAQAAPAPSVQQVQYTAQQAKPAAAPAAPNGSSTTAGGATIGAGGGRQIANRQQVLRHQQQRLLLLRHAAKCQHEDGKCPVTPHCAGMKRLWKHIAECKNQKCLVPHCVSSRYVLSHYHRCKDVRCPVCGPVREAIHRSHEKQKHMQALKQRHQQALQQKQQHMQGSAPQGAPASMPLQPGAAVTSTASVEPPNKRRKTSGVLTAPSFQVQQRPLQQPSGARPIMPSQQTGIAYAQQQQQQQPIRAQIGSAPGIAFSNGQVIMPKYTGPKPQEDHTLINCFSVEQIERHLASLSNGLHLPPQKLKVKCLDVLKLLQSHQHAWVFNTPVDPVELGLPDYFEVIKKPMDLGTIRKKLENGVYQKLEDFEAHALLTFDNAMLYNPEGSVVYNMAKEMKEKFQRDYAKLIQQLNAEEDVKRRNGEACSLCGCEKLLFEPPVFYCNGMNCPSKRIRRNSYYYVGGNNQYHWCHQCFQELRDNSTLDLGDIQIKKDALVKKKNDEVHEESWVQCDRCERWVHQICALFNTRQNKDQRSEYACPRCTIEERKKKGSLEATSSTPMAEDLPRTVLSEFLEDHVRRKVDEFVEKKSQDKSKNENMPIEEARKKLQMGGAITIRQVTSMDRKLEVRERMKKRYAFKNYPDEFTFRCKCIVVFQNLDGVDVMLFGLYVYEHDENNPSPNKRAVYISYLDSVHYMRPRQMRTFIYHEILISYLDYVRRRGFATAHIWACPPLKGDDYILYAKPEDQKTPRDDRLRQWYIEMLVECQRRGIVGKLTNMYDLYFSNPKNDATVVPYMDGDYFPAEAENIIKDIEDGKSGKKSSSVAKKKDKKVKQKKKSGRGGTRSTGLDEEALKASGILPVGADQKSLEEGGRDYVMTKLGETIHPMKDSFIVAYLSWKEAEEENMVVPKAIQEYRDQHNISWKLDEKGEDVRVNMAKEQTEKPKDEEEGGVTKDTKPEESKPVESKAPEGSNSEFEGKAADSEEQPKSEDPKPEGAPSAKAEESEKKPADASANPDAREASNSTEAMEVENAGPSSSSSSAHVENPPSPAGSPEEGAQEKTQETVPAAEDEAKEQASTQGSEAPAQEAEAPSKEVEDSVKKAEASANASEECNGSGPAPMEGVENKEDATANGEVAQDAPKTASEASPREGMEKEENASVDGGVAEDIPKTEATLAPASETAEEEKKETNGSSETKPDESTTEKQADPSKPTSTNMAIRVGKFAAMAARKRDRDGIVIEPEKKEEKAEKPERPEKPSRAYSYKDSKGSLIKVLDDDEEEMDCEFLNNRQAFLNLCQGNHYQFDYLRRAKHSSMMVLWHLHNRDAPKFVQQCATCSREILSGLRYHCPTCADFDQCPECVANPKIPRHPHPLKPIPISGQQPELTEAQRRERQRSIQLHMTLLQHAATCNSAKCPSANCTKMKGLLKHGAQCQIKATGGCNVCKRIWALLQIHARQCKLKNCLVPNCMAIRERVRQLKKQQQAMDDRRRIEMNRAYRGKR